MVSELHQGTFNTIEGNTNDEGCANGYEVCKRNRAFSNEIDFIGFYPDRKPPVQPNAGP